MDVNVRCEILKTFKEKNPYDLRVCKDFLTPKVWCIIAEIDKFDYTEIMCSLCEGDKETRIC